MALGLPINSVLLLLALVGNSGGYSVDDYKTATHKETFTREDSLASYIEDATRRFAEIYGAIEDVKNDLLECQKRSSTLPREALLRREIHIQETKACRMEIVDLKSKNRQIKMHLRRYMKNLQNWFISENEGAIIPNRTDEGFGVTLNKNRSETTDSDTVTEKILSRLTESDGEISKIGQLIDKPPGLDRSSMIIRTNTTGDVRTSTGDVRTSTGDVRTSSRYAMKTSSNTEQFNSRLHSNSNWENEMFANEVGFNKSITTTKNSASGTNIRTNKKLNESQKITTPLLENQPNTKMHTWTNAPIREKNQAEYAYNIKGTTDGHPRTLTTTKYFVRNNSDKKQFDNHNTTNAPTGSKVFKDRSEKGYDTHEPTNVQPTTWTSKKHSAQNGHNDKSPINHNPTTNAPSRDLIRGNGPAKNDLNINHLTDVFPTTPFSKVQYTQSDHYNKSVNHRSLANEQNITVKNMATTASINPSAKRDSDDYLMKDQAWPIAFKQAEESCRKHSYDLIVELGGCYKHHVDLKTPKHAAAVCEGEGGKLISFKNQRELTIVWDWLKRTLDSGFWKWYHWTSGSYRDGGLKWGDGRALVVDDFRWDHNFVPCKRDIQCITFFNATLASFTYSCSVEGFFVCQRPVV